jgi:hypothetical protein
MNSDNQQLKRKRNLHVVIRAILQGQQGRLQLKNGVFWVVTPHGLTTQKTPFFIVTAAKTSNLTSITIICLFS